MGVVQKTATGKNDKKKNKVKDNLKNKLESNIKFPKVKNAEKSTGPIQNGEPKKKFEKNLKKGGPPGGSPKPKQDDSKKSPNKKKNKKNKKGLKQKPNKPVKIEVEDAITDTPLTAEETKAAVKVAKSTKEDGKRINKLLTKILKKCDAKEDEPEPTPIVAGLQLEELVSKEKLKKHVNNFMKIVNHMKAQPDYKTKLINDKRLITLSVMAMKIADCPNKNSKIKLPVPLYSADSEICLFVADLERGRKRDDEPFVRHYEEILEKNGVTCVNKIITTSHLIKEYSTYELKFRLANTYDVFLVEGKVSNRVGKFLGKIFSNIKRNPVAIKDFTKETIDSALNTVTYRQSGLGPVNVINFAYDTMTESQITENLYNLIQQLKKIYPGGWSNIKSLMLTALKEVAYPIMYNFAIPNDIPVPKLKSIRDVKIEKAKALLDGALQKVEITRDGVVVKKKSKRKLDENDLPSNSDNEEPDNSPPKAKKKIAEIKEPASEEVPTTKKDKKKKKNKQKEVQQVIVESPKPVELIKKQKNKKNKQLKANFKESDISVVTNKKSGQNAKFEKSTDGVKPKKKKINKTN